MSKENPVLLRLSSAQLEQAKAFFGQAVNLMKAKQHSSAERLLKQVLKIIPEHANSHQLLSIIAAERGDLNQALLSINTAIAHHRSSADFYFNRAMIYQRLEQHQLAHADLEHIVSINPSYYPAHLALARIFQTQKQYPQAINCYKRCVELVNNDESIWNDFSSVYLALEQYADAIKCNDISLHLKSNNAKTYAIRGKINYSLCNYEEAIQAYSQALKLNPDVKAWVAALLSCKNRLCDWRGYEEALPLVKEELLTTNDTKPFALSSFEALSLPLTPKEHYQLATNEYHFWIKSSANLNQGLEFKHDPKAKPQRLRIAYISSSFRNFPTGHLTQDLYALHDRNNFEVFVYSYGIDDQSVFRKKIQQGCDHFTDIQHFSIEQAAQAIYADKINILVDLMGFTTDARLEINALRPAPINVRYLGSPSTSGAPFFDYFISDPFITPPSAQPYFSEHLVLMPHSYQVNPLQQTVSTDTPSRAECGLPETGIVFCAFNNCYKIEPMIFQSWMNILQAVPNSVLWLQASGLTQGHLIQNAQQYNITAERLVFADKMPKDRHLARHVHADLYLDTHIYNAHTTASDALWMNVPVITYPGHTFQSRVAGSLLNALGLNELIMPDLSTYESTAIALASNPQALKRLKDKLKQYAQTQPLFDTKRFVTHLEQAYQQMWKNYQQNNQSLIEVND